MKNLGSNPAPHAGGSVITHTKPPEVIVDKASISVIGHLLYGDESPHGVHDLRFRIGSLVAVEIHKENGRGCGMSIHKENGEKLATVASRNRLELLMEAPGSPESSSCLSL